MTFHILVGPERLKVLYDKDPLRCPDQVCSVKFDGSGSIMTRRDAEGRIESISIYVQLFGGLDTSTLLLIFIVINLLMDLYVFLVEILDKHKSEALNLIR